MGVERQTICRSLFATVTLVDVHPGTQATHAKGIELKGAYSFFEVEKNKTDTILKGFEGVEFRNRAVRVEITGGKPASDKKKKSFHKNSSSNSGGGGKGKKWGRQKQRY